MEKVYVDKGLRTYFMNIYQYIATNLALAGAIAFAIASSATMFNLIVTTPLFYVVLFAPLGIVWYMGSNIHHISVNKAQTLYWLYGASIGASLSSIFIVYSMDSIVRCFFMAAAVFMAAAMYGRFTSKDLSSMRSTLMVALFGIIGVSIVNMFLHSSGLQYLLSIAIVIIFSAYIAYDMQQLLAIYFTRQSDEMSEKASIMGALHLFISMLNIFLALLHLFGNRRK